MRNCSTNYDASAKRYDQVPGYGIIFNQNLKDTQKSEKSKENRKYDHLTSESQNSRGNADNRPPLTPTPHPKPWDSLGFIKSHLMVFITL